jgi:hypothetical protein
MRKQGLRPEAATCRITQRARQKDSPPGRRRIYVRQYLVRIVAYMFTLVSDAAHSRFCTVSLL